jgi:hypothetical protein
VNTIDRVNATELERAARRIVVRKLGFYLHAAVYVAVSLLLLAMFLAGGRQGWSAWPLAGWGIGLAAHALVALGPVHRVLAAMTRRERERLVARGDDVR